MSTPAELYAERILDRAPLVLGLMDREPLSPTAGCCDRTFWAWKFVDFPAPRFQEALCTLAYLWRTPLGSSAYHQNDALRDWIGLGLGWWCSRQHGDGSFDEAYPFERSLAATAFTTFYVSEALELLGDAAPRPAAERARGAIAAAGRWLCRNDEHHGVLSNHLAAAAAACQHAFRAGGEAACEGRARYFLERILAEQSAEGWYREYEGADPGYQTHGSFYLARLAELSGDPRIPDSVARATRFLAHFVHPDGSIGGEYASRNTQTYYPAAFEMLAPRCEAAAFVAETLRPSVAGAQAAGIRAVDVWNLFPMLNNLVFAHRATSAAGWAPLAARDPAPDLGIVEFPEAGLVRVRRTRYDAVVATGKGGVTKIWDREGRRLVLGDCGFVARTARGAVLSTASFDRERPVRVEPDAISVSGRAAALSRPTFSPLRFLAFRAFSLTVGRSAFVARWLKQLLVYVLVNRRKRADFRFERRIELGERGVRIVDHLTAGEPVAHLVRADRFAAVHMGSSRYFVSNELEPLPAPSGEVPTADLASGIDLMREVVIPERGHSNP